MKTRSCFIGTLLLLAHDSAYAIEVERKVSLEEGRRLVKLALVAENIADVYEDPSDEELQDPIITFPILGIHLGKLTDYGVNAWTGDVWDTYECRRITSPQLAAEQAKIKKLFHGVELKEYPRLHQLKPERGYDLEPCGSAQ